MKQTETAFIEFSSSNKILKDSKLLFSFPTYSDGSHPFTGSRLIRGENTEDQVFDVSCTRNADISAANPVCRYSLKDDTLRVEGAFTQEAAANQAIVLQIEKFYFSTDEFYNIKFKVEDKEGTPYLILPRHTIRSYAPKLRESAVDYISTPQAQIPSNPDEEPYSTVPYNGFDIFYESLIPTSERPQDCHFLIFVVSRHVNLRNSKVMKGEHGIWSQGQNWVLLSGLCSETKILIGKVLKDLEMDGFTKINFSVWKKLEDEPYKLKVKLYEANTFIVENKEKNYKYYVVKKKFDGHSPVEEAIEEYRNSPESERNPSAEKNCLTTNDEIIGPQVVTEFGCEIQKREGSGNIIVPALDFRDPPAILNGLAPYYTSIRLQGVTIPECFKNLSILEFILLNKVTLDYFVSDYQGIELALKDQTLREGSLQISRITSEDTEEVNDTDAVSIQLVDYTPLPITPKTQILVIPPSQIDLSHEGVSCTPQKSISGATCEVKQEGDLKGFLVTLTEKAKYDTAEVQIKGISKGQLQDQAKFQVIISYSSSACPDTVIARGTTTFRELQIQNSEKIKVTKTSNIFGAKTTLNLTWYSGVEYPRKSNVKVTQQDLFLIDELPICSTKYSIFGFYVRPCVVEGSSIEMERLNHGATDAYHNLTVKLENVYNPYCSSDCYDLKVSVLKRNGKLVEQFDGAVNRETELEKDIFVSEGSFEKGVDAATQTPWNKFTLSFTHVAPIAEGSSLGIELPNGAAYDEETSRCTADEGLDSGASCVLDPGHYDATLKISGLSKRAEGESKVVLEKLQVDETPGKEYKFKVSLRTSSGCEYGHAEITVKIPEEGE